MARRKKQAFPDRVVLGEGFPWVGGNKPYKTAMLCKEPTGVAFIDLEFPLELWKTDAPRYRLVLERVPNEGGKPCRRASTGR